MSVFCFVDRIEDVQKDENLTASFTLKGDEEFLKDHFDGFPVMPGVLLLESLKQAAVSLLARDPKSKNCSYCLIQASDIRFGQFVKPGSRLKIFVRRLRNENELIFFEGRIDIVNAALKKALTAQFTLTPVDSLQRLPEAGAAKKNHIQNSGRIV